MLHQILVLAGYHPEIAALWLYGSRARGSHHADSDYDIGVAYTNWIDSPVDRRLRPELLAMDWQHQLEVSDDTLSIVDIAIAPIPLSWTVISKGQLLMDRYPQERMRQESRIMSQWEIDYLDQRKRHA